MGLSITEIMVILIVVLLLFDSKRIPELAKALGRASHEFKKAKDGIMNETQEMMDAAEKNAEAEDQLKEKKNADRNAKQD